MSKRNKRASVSYNIDFHASNENNKINTSTNFKINTEKNIDALSLENSLKTMEIAAKTVEACADSAEAAARSTANLANKFMRQATINHEDEKLQQQKSVIIETIAEAAVATATAARIAAKISQMGNNVTEKDIQKCVEDDDNTEELIEEKTKNNNKIKVINIDKTVNENQNSNINQQINNINEENINKKPNNNLMEMKPRSDLNNIEHEIYNTTEDEFYKKPNVSCPLPVHNITDTPNSFSIPISPAIDNPFERNIIKNLFDSCFKKIKNSLSIMSKNGIDIDSLKNKINLILDDIEISKSNSEILLHLIKDEFDDIYEQIKDGCMLNIEFFYDAFEGIITNLSELRKRNISQNVLRDKFYELLFSLPKQHPSYKIKDKLDDIQETIEDITHQTLVNMGIKREPLDETQNISEQKPNINIQNHTQMYNNTINDIENEIQAIKSNNLNALEVNFDKIKNETIEYIQTFKNNAINIIMQQGIDLQKQSEKIISLHNKEIDLIKQRGDTTILEISNSFKEKEQQITKNINQSVDYLSNRMEKISQLVNKIDDYYDNKLSDFNDALNEIKEEVQDYISDLNCEIQESKNTIQDNLEDMIEETTKLATEKLMDVYEKGMNFKKEIEESNENNKKSVIDYISSFVQNCKQNLENELNKISENMLLDFIKLIRDEGTKTRNSLNIDDQINTKLKKCLEQLDEHTVKKKNELDIFGGEMQNSIQNNLKNIIQDETNKQINKIQSDLNQTENDIKLNLKKSMMQSENELEEKTKQMKEELKYELKTEMYKIKEELKNSSQDEIQKLREQCIDEVHREIGAMMVESMEICDNLYNRINSFSLSLTNYLVNQNISTESIKELQNLLNDFNTNITEIKNTIEQNKIQTNRIMNKNFKKINNTIKQELK